MPIYESSSGKIFLYLAVWNLRNHKGPYSDNQAEDCRGEFGGRDETKMQHSDKEEGLLLHFLDCVKAEHVIMKANVLLERLEEIY